MFKIVPAGRGMAMLQSEPMPTAEAEAKLAKINDEMGEDMPDDGEKPEAMPAFGGKPPIPGGGPGGGGMPAMQPMGASARPGRPRPGGPRTMPEFGL